MAEGLASAVTLPDQDTIASSPETSLKRKSSITDPDTKRRRLSAHDDDHDRTSNRNDDEAGDCRRSSTGVGTEPTPVKEPEEEREKGDRKPRTTRPPAPGRRDDERKRGQRLFGGLLGTLSQSSTSTAQRRRADIERKQQEKLKLQDAEYGEVKKKRREDRMVIRKKEQRVYEEESMRTRHSNLLAMARFLKTKTEPTLFCSTTNRGNYGLETRTLYRIKSTTQRISSLEKSQNSKPAFHRQAKKEEKREEKKDNQPRNPRNQKRNLLKSQLRCLNRNPRRSPMSPMSPKSPKRQRMSRHQT